MLESMRQLALAYLWLELDGGASPDPEVWYCQTRENDLGRLFPYLVEDVDTEGKGKEKPRFYTLSPDPADEAVAVLESHELTDSQASKLPFNQPSGSQAAALGPLIKRTAPTKGKTAGPSVKIQETTLKAFETIAKEGEPWSEYFREARACWVRPRVRLLGRGVVDAEGGALRKAIEQIDEKRTVLLAFRTAQGRLPGEVSEYAHYLQQMLATSKYATGAVQAVNDKTCMLCGCHPVTIYPNALRGAGINLANLDREGAFPGLDVQCSWKSYGACVDCADLLYVFWHHVAADYLTRVAGEDALVIPTLKRDPARWKGFIKRVHDWIAGVQGSAPGRDQIVVRERQLLTILGEEQAVSTLSILWAEFGQRIDDIRGLVTDVLPSRLQHLAMENRDIEGAKSPLFPEHELEDFRYGVSLSLLRPLFCRPGGKKAQSRNESRRLFDLRRDVVEAIYHAAPIPQERFWAEIHETARWHWGNALTSDAPTYSLLREGWSGKRQEAFLTVAGWVRQLARFLHYCRQLGVMSMPDPDNRYEPGCPILKPYFGEESGIDSPEKAFAFILGALYGKLLQVQAARDVNVGANALTWLKRLTLAGKDLPELYVKVREKLMVYGTEGNEVVRQLVIELGELGARLGTKIDLDDTQTCYYLLLGQSLALKMMPSREGQKGESDA